MCCLFSHWSYSHKSYFIASPFHCVACTKAASWTAAWMQRVLREASAQPPPPPVPPTAQQVRAAVELEFAAQAGRCCQWAQSPHCLTSLKQFRSYPRSHIWAGRPLTHVLSCARWGRSRHSCRRRQFWHLRRIRRPHSRCERRWSWSSLPRPAGVVSRNRAPIV